MKPIYRIEFTNIRNANQQTDVDTPEEVMEFIEKNKSWLLDPDEPKELKVLLITNVFYPLRPKILENELRDCKNDLEDAEVTRKHLPQNIANLENKIRRLEKLVKKEKRQHEAFLKQAE